MNPDLDADLDPAPYTVIERADGGLDVTLHLGPVESQAARSELHELATGLRTTLWALGVLRTGTVTDDDGVRAPRARDWREVVFAVYYRLIGRLEGVGAAAVRAHAVAGGSVGDLASAMNVPRSTAQHRRAVILAAEASGAERWATGTLGSWREDRSRSHARQLGVDAGEIGPTHSTPE